MARVILSEQTADRIRQLIERQYKPGDRIPAEMELAEFLGVSRTTIREAVKILCSRNILEIRRGHGTFVCENPGLPADPFGSKDMDEEQLKADIFEMSLLLEPELVFQLLRTPEDAFDGACLYTRIVGGTVLLQGLYIQLCAVLRSYTLLKEVVVLSVSMNLLNVAGNAILINGFFGFPQMGVAGAAVSTVISKAVGLTLACITLKRKCTVRFSLQYLHPFPAKTFRALLGIALPSGTEALSYNVSQTFILRFINLMGAAVVSAKVYGSMLANVAYVYSIAVGQATQIILGYMIGSRKLDEVSGRVWSTIRIALAASELLTLLILIFCDPIYSIFTDDPVIHALGRQILYVEFGLEFGRYIYIVMTRCLTTAGDVWYPVGVGIFSMWVVAVGGSWLLGHALNWGLVGIWIAMACDECLRGALFTIRFRSGKWKETRLVSDSTKGT